MARPVILLNWSYRRMDLLLPFFQLKDDFTIIFLFHKGVDDTLIKGVFRKIDWEDYDSPYELLEEIKPDKVVFHDIESFFQFALNLAAHNNNITTYVLEHGFKTSKAIPEIIKHDKENRRKRLQADDHSARDRINRRSSLGFFLRSIKPVNLFSLHAIMRFALIRKYNPLTYALVNCRIKIRQADYYINFTYDNSSYFRIRDGISDSKLRLIGNPFLDYFFKDDKQGIFNFDYYLLIDSPLTELSWFNVSVEKRNEFINKLISYCRARNCKLVIKLHPLSYGSDLPVVSQDVIYIKESFTSALIKECKGCFAFTSTLLLLAAIYKPSILFRIKYNGIEEEFVRTGCFNVLDFNTFNLEDIDFSHEKSDEERAEILIEKYFYKTDGNSTERLKRILIG